MCAAYLNKTAIEAAARAAERSLDVPVCVVDAEMRLMCALNDKSGAFARLVSRLLSAASDAASAASKAAELSIFWKNCDGEGEVLCYIAAPEEGGELAAAYLATLISTECCAHAEANGGDDGRKRSMLVCQLAGSGNIDSEADSYLSALGYKRELPRCALLCIADGALDGSSSGSPAAELERWAAGVGILASEDIYGSVNDWQMIVYKALPCLDYASYSGTIRDMAGAMSDYLFRRCGVRLRVYAGSAYQSVASLHKSYAEAAYLYASDCGGGECLFINDFLFEWLYSNLDGAARRNLTRDIADALDEGHEIAATAAVLSLSECSPIRCAEKLSAHRNTVLQRVKKIKEKTGLDPLHNVRDRVALRACILHRTRKTIWNGGVIVQPGSVLSLGLRRLSELLYQKSGGGFQINVQTVSTSGDNYKLCGMLMSGALDAIVSSTIALCPYTDNKSLILHLPFLFNSADEAEAVVRGTVLPELRGSLEEAGIICQDLWSMGWRYITSSDTPIRRPSDLAGRRIRILASASIREYFASLGAVPLQIYYNNVKDALASNIINCQENPYKNILDMEFYKYQDYVTELPIWYSMEALCFSKRSWLELDADRRELLRQAVAECCEWVRLRQTETNASAKDALMRLGMRVVVPTEEETDLWRWSVRPLYESEARREFLTKIMKAKRRYAKSGR